jgi:hypothetical protein
VQHRQRYVGLLFPADAEPPKPVYPPARVFYHPASCPETCLILDGLGVLTRGTDIDCKTKFLVQVSHFSVIIAPVKVKLLRWLGSRPGPFNGKAFNGCTKHFKVVTVLSVEALLPF